MRIHRVRIDNLRCLRDFEVSFCDASGQPRPLTVLVGPNMSGKTTVLDALHLVYEGLFARTATFRQGFDPDDLSLRWDSRRPIAAQLEFSLANAEQDAIDGLLGDLNHPAVTLERHGSYRLGFEWPRPLAAPADMSALREIDVSTGKPWFIWYALLGRALAREARAKRLGSEGVFERVGGLIYLDQHRSAHLRVPSIDSGPENELRERAGDGDVMPWLELASRLDQKWDVATQGESAWSRVKRLYAELAAPATIDDIVATDQGFDLRLRCGERVYYASGVSSGERQMLRLAATLTALRAVRSVVLIDELELHLHPRWQRNLLHFCRHGGGGDNQFIVTTHSSSVLDYVDPADVVRLGGEL